VTFLFTDIERSTELARELADGYRDVLLEHRRYLTDAFEGSGGVVYSTLGDEVSAVYASAAEAIAGAVAAQRALATWSHTDSVRVRMGIHSGRATEGDAGEHVGLDVHRTARVCGAAHGGQVLLSGAAAQAAGVGRPPGTAFRRLGSYTLQGFPEPEALVQLVIAGTRTEFPEPRAATPADAAAPRQASMPVMESLRRAVSTVRSRRQAEVRDIDRREKSAVPTNPRLDRRHGVYGWRSGDDRF